MAKAKTKPYEERLLGIAAWVLSQNAAITRAEIYAAFPDHYRGKADAKEKMFSRDKDALRKLGFNVETTDVGGDDQVGYTIDAHSSMLPPIELTADEAAAAWTAGLAALRLSAHPLAEELESALRKLVVGTRGLPPRAAATDDLPSGAEAERDELLPKLEKACETRQRIRIGYWRVSANEVVEREVDVYGWARRRGEWLFVGYCHLRGGVRIFYLSRVRSLRFVKISKEEAELRARRGGTGDYEIPEAFDIRAWSRQQIWEYAVHPPVAATVRFRGSVAGIARNLLPAADFSNDGEGGRVARLDVRNLRGLVRQALAWGPDAEVTSPPEARALAREILASTVSTEQRGTP
jgi:predicted DNA-binding transcriptional regulator YafY